MNLSEKDYTRKKNKHLAKIAEWMKEHAAGDPILPISVAFEERLTGFETEEAAAEECKNIGIESALPKIITTMRKALHLRSFFTVGPDEVRQWTIREGTKAPQAAGVIHTDFEKGFIKAEVVSFDDLVAAGSMAKAKEAGKVRMEGKDYVMADGDVVEFRFNV